MTPRLRIEVGHPFRPGDFVRSARLAADGIVEVDPDGTIWVLWGSRPGNVSHTCAPKIGDESDLSLLVAAEAP